MNARKWLSSIPLRTFTSKLPKHCAAEGCTAEGTGAEGPDGLLEVAKWNVVH